MFNIGNIIKYLMIIFFIIFDSSFLKGLGYPWFNVNLLISFIIFLVIKDGVSKNLILIIFSGLLLDFFSGGVFGLSIVVFLLLCFLIDLLFLYLFTNKSWFSLLVLGIIGVWFNIFLNSGLKYFFYWLNMIDNNIIINKLFFYNLIWQTVFVLIALLILLFLDNVFNKKQEVRL